MASGRSEAALQMIQNPNKCTPFGEKWHRLRAGWPSECWNSLPGVKMKWPKSEEFWWILMLWGFVSKENRSPKAVAEKISNDPHICKNFKNIRRRFENKSLLPHQRSFVCFKESFPTIQFFFPKFPREGCFNISPANWVTLPGAGAKEREISLIDFC